MEERAWEDVLVRLPDGDDAVVRSATAGGRRTVETVSLMANGQAEASASPTQSVLVHPPYHYLMLCMHACGF